MNDELKFYVICYIRNIIVLICFTILAIFFNKWWIVLFSMLFWVSVAKDKEEKDKEEEKEDLTQQNMRIQNEKQWYK